MSNGTKPTEPEQRVRVTIGVNLADKKAVGGRLSDAARVYLMTECGATIAAPFNISLSIYWFVREAWEKFFVYAGAGDPPPRPY